ncbi:hypothetical protein HY837_03070, partial [archaeon]|nr:hypothetical protein [archaeon]
MSRDLDFYTRLYEKIRPSSERIAQSVAELNVTSFIEDLLAQVRLATLDVRTVHDLAPSKGNLEDELKYLTHKKYQKSSIMKIREKIKIFLRKHLFCKGFCIFRYSKTASVNKLCHFFLDKVDTVPHGN